MQKVNQHHRELAASKIKGDDAKSRKVRESILAGKSDEHPSIQAAAFYEFDGNIGNRE